MTRRPSGAFVQLHRELELAYAEAAAQVACDQARLDQLVQRFAGPGQPEYRSLALDRYRRWLDGSASNH